MIVRAAYAIADAEAYIDAYGTFVSELMTRSRNELSRLRVYSRPRSIVGSELVTLFSFMTSLPVDPVV